MKVVYEEALNNETSNIMIVNNNIVMLYNNFILKKSNDQWTKVIDIIGAKITEWGTIDLSKDIINIFCSNDEIYVLSSNGKVSRLINNNGTLQTILEVESNGNLIELINMDNDYYYIKAGSERWDVMNEIKDNE